MSGHIVTVRCGWAVALAGWSQGALESHATQENSHGEFTGGRGRKEETQSAPLEIS